MTGMDQNGDFEPAASDKPVPRRPKSPAKLAQIHVQNRRREYLHRNATYLESLEHELAGTRAQLLRCHHTSRHTLMNV